MLPSRGWRRGDTMAYVVAAAVIVAALAAGYGAYSASEAQAQQYNAEKKARF